MQLINKEDDPAFRLSHFLQHGLEPLFKFAPVLCTGDQCAHIQGEDRLIPQALRHVTLDNPLGQPFGDGRFADAGLADQDGVILRLSGKNADDVSDLIIPADDRVHFLLSRPLDKVCAEFFQGLVGVLRVVIGDALVAADGLQGLQNVLLLQLIGGKQLL